MRIYLKLLALIVFFPCLGVGFGWAEELEAQFYEKSEIRERMEKREVISVVKIVPHGDGEKMKVLEMTAAGIVDGVPVPRALKLMSDYENLQKIAPDYIKMSEMIVKKREGKFQKYLHMKTEIKTILGTYKLEIYSKVSEEQSQDKGWVHWEVISGNAIGRQNAPGDFVGLKGFVRVENYKRSDGVTATPQASAKGFYRSRPKKDQVMMLFKGKLERDQKGISKIIPNFVLQFAMEVALQRVGILLRNYLETSKELPPERNLDDLVQEGEKRGLSSPVAQ
ncbi:MAG: hypothetical protein A2Z91_05550 [Deltaproteobacteria bacterium GWA2_38_16]|nr:MAG: hypothetical protein A2Z91_05550 [Deltaproteobacteria bacterium GWA2_38_16]